MEQAPPCSDIVDMDALASDGRQCSGIPENLPAAFQDTSWHRDRVTNQGACLQGESQKQGVDSMSLALLVHLMVSPSMCVQSPGMFKGSRGLSGKCIVEGVCSFWDFLAMQMGLQCSQRDIGL